MKSILYAVVAGLLLSSAAFADQDRVASADKTFAEKAAQGGLTEVKLGQLAQEKSSNPKIKDFGDKLVRDHTKANDELKQIAAEKGVKLPGDLSAEQKQHYAKLDKLNGAAFDKAFIDHMVNDHQKDIGEFQKEAGSGKDAAIKEFAGSTLPTLKEHLKIAQDLSNENKPASGQKHASRKHAHSGRA
jgi:putative membrane protein